ncbi:MAG: dihydrofolate reductase [Saprospiraceae bacterium]
MQKIKFFFLLLLSISVFAACQESKPEANDQNADAQTGAETKVLLDTFADLQILRYDLPGWDKLDLRQKTLIYHLSEATLAGRDIIYDQHCKYNLTIRKTLEAIYTDYKGERSGAEWDAFETYAKRVWFSNGIHHHYNEVKMIPECSQEYFTSLIKACPEGSLPLNGASMDDFVATAMKVMYDTDFMAKRTNKDKNVDIVAASAVNFYDGVSTPEVEKYYGDMLKNAGKNAPLFGLNSKLVKENGKLKELVWKAGDGMYGPAIDKIIMHLEAAIPFAENDKQKEAIRLLIEYYQSGDLRKFDEYNIAWVKDTEGEIDFINGFIEVYHDPKGIKADWEAVVQYNDPDATEKMAIISSNAQYFEDNSPIMDEHKKAEVKGVSYRVINVAMEGGDCAPSTPIGINLPNSNWIRQEAGSKSISLNNIENAYNKAGGAMATKEFANDDDEIQRAKKYSEACGKMHTALHEVIGHASGQLNDGIAEPNITLKQYSSTLEEARADLVALYFMPDPKLIEWGVMPDGEAYKAEYDSYIRNGLFQQYRRINPGDDLEEDHMRNRQLNAAWAFEKGAADGVIAKESRDGKTYYDIKDYEKLRVIFGELLREIQRIKSEGDYEAAEALVEGYGVKVDPEAVKEVKSRYASLNTKAYSGFVQPKLVPVMDADGKITDVKVEIETDFIQQMLRYGKEYSFLPPMN